MALNKFQLTIGSGIVVLSLCTTAFQAVQSHKYRDMYSSMLSENAAIHQKIMVQHNDKESLEKAVQDLSDENLQLDEMLSDLKVAPSEVRYITRTETKLIPAEPVISYPDLPDHHDFILADGIKVADFSHLNNNYVFTTYTLSFRNTLVISKNKSDVLTQVSSSADNTWHDVDTTLQVVDTAKHYPMIAPQLFLGLASGFPEYIPEPIFGSSFLHLSKSLDILSPAISVGPSPYFVIYAASYNIGSPLPIVSDLWLSAGPSIDITGEAGVSVAITTNL